MADHLQAGMTIVGLVIAAFAAAVAVLRRYLE
jgi:hypothetical protein